MGYNLYVDLCSNRFPSVSGLPLHVTRVAAIAEEDGHPVGKMAALVRPDGWGIDNAVQPYLRAPYDQCVAEGLPVAIVAHELRCLCVDRMRVIAHNIAYHQRILQLLLNACDTELSEFHGSFFCSMREAAPLIPGKFRTVSLPQAYETLCAAVPRDPPNWQDHALNQVQMVRALWQAVSGGRR
jgi:hypothetical protein